MGLDFVAGGLPDSGMVQNAETLPSTAESQKHLVDFLFVALTSDDGVAYQFSKKYGSESNNKEIERLRVFATRIYDKRFAVDIPEHFFLMAEILIRETKGAKTNWATWMGKFIMNKFFKKLGQKHRTHLSAAARCMCQYQTLRGVVTTWKNQNKHLGKTGDQDFNWKEKFFYGHELMYELQRYFPEHKEIIRYSFRTKVAQILKEDGFGEHAKRRYERLLASRPENSGMVKYFLADICYYYSDFCDNPEEKLKHLYDSNHNYYYCDRGRGSATGLVWTGANLAKTYERLGRLREAVRDYEYTLMLLEDFQNFWDENVVIGWRMQRLYILADAYCCLGKYSVAAEKYEMALQCFERLQELDQPSMLPHKPLGPYLKMRVALNRAPASEAKAIRRKYLQDIEEEIRNQSPDSDNIPKVAFKRWFNANTLKSYVKNKQETSYNIIKDIGDRVYMTNSFHDYDSFRKQVEQELEISEWLGQYDPKISDVEVLPDTSVCFHILLEAILICARKGEDGGSYDESMLTKPQHEFLKVIQYHAHPDSFLFCDLVQHYSEIMNLYEWNIPQEIFISMKYLADAMPREPLSYSAKSRLHALAGIFERLESLTINYSHPEDLYLVRRKLQNVYANFAESALQVMFGLNAENKGCVPLLYNFISAASERSVYYPLQAEPDRNHFTGEELELPEVKDFLEKSRTLASERRRMVFPEHEDVTPGEGSAFFTKRLGSEYASNRKDSDLEVLRQLRVSQAGYDKSLEKLKEILPEFTLPKPYLRSFDQAPPCGVLRLHLFKLGNHILCVGYLGGEVAGSYLPEFDNAAADDSVMTRLGNLIDTCVGYLPAVDIDLLELCMQAPLEAVPWIVLKDFVKIIPDNTPYRYDIGVGFTSAIALNNEPTGTKKVVLGPPAERTDLALGSLEFYTAWQQEDNSVRIELPPDANEFLAAAAEAKILHFTGHFGYRDDGSLMDSAITALSDDEGGISLGFLQAQKTLLNGGIVILNLCESGRSGSEKLKDDISVRISDSPRSANAQAATSKALAATFLSKGASCVIATLWHVEDLPSFLFTRKLIQLLGESVAIGDAVEQASLWLKDITRPEALAVVNATLEIAPDEYIDNERVKARIKKELDELTAGPEMPFSHPSHWAAHVVYGHGNM